MGHSVFQRSVYWMCIKAGSTALHLAAQNGHNETARILLFAGCNASAKNNVNLHFILFTFHYEKC